MSKLNEVIQRVEKQDYHCDSDLDCGFRKVAPKMAAALKLAMEALRNGCRRELECMYCDARAEIESIFNDEPARDKGEE